MKMAAVLSGVAALLVAGHALGGGEAAPVRPATEAQAAALDLTGWTLPHESGALAPRSADLPAAAPVDVVDAHWMALTMWGEARGAGAEGMRAVGHVIDNRRRAGMHGRYATDQVGEAFQFNCWNPGDPNLAKMLNVEALPPGSREHELWMLAKRLADDILAGRSVDTTEGALFYHTTAVAPRWSRGVPPVRQIGSHLFFLHAR